MVKIKNLLKITVPIFVAVAAASLLPRIFPCVDTTQFGGNYRVPYSLGEDYFLYEKYAETVAASGRTAVIGDSVIWGHYTGNSGNLTAHLNSCAGAGKFANAGIDGIHPVALYGLIDSYCGSLKNGKVVIGINLLWMSSPKHDLSGGVNTSINHRALLPQICAKIPAYSPEVEERLTLLARRDIVFFSWIDHIRSSLFAHSNIFRWTMENPRTCPRRYFSHDDESFTPPDPVHPDRMTGRDMDWVRPESSFQWRYMLASVRRLKEQGNRVVAVITPFNSFMLTGKGRAERDAIILQIQQELAADGVAALLPVLDRPEYFADLSHPVAEGYAVMASWLAGNSDFKLFME